MPASAPASSVADRLPVVEIEISAAAVRVEADDRARRRLDRRAQLGNLEQRHAELRMQRRRAHFVVMAAPCR